MDIHGRAAIESAHRGVLFGPRTIGRRSAAVPSGPRPWGRLEPRMSIDTTLSAVTGTVAAEVSASRGRSARDRVQDAALPISGKHALLHARRMRQREARTATRPLADVEGALRLRTEDGAVTFVLRPAASGLVVERTQRRPLGACFVQSFLFTDHEGFRRWCEADAVRFDEPVLYDRLRREGDARLSGKR